MLQECLVSYKDSLIEDIPGAMNKLSDLTRIGRKSMSQILNLSLYGRVWLR